MNVEFMGQWRERDPATGDKEDRKPFAVLSENRESIHEPEKMMKGWMEADGFEAAVGTKNLIDASLLELLARYRKSVCRIQCEGIDFRGLQLKWHGTGFLVAPNLLLTNNHVLNSPEVAATATADFEYERTPKQLLDFETPSTSPRREMRLDPDRLFLTSPARGGLDYTFVWVSDDAVHQYGHIPLSRGSFSGRPYEPVFLIHHPNGDFKQASVDDTELLNIDVDLLLYAADTEGGSSGAPVITRNGKLFGLHHAFCDIAKLELKHQGRKKRLEDGGDYKVANEGIKISAIAADLERRLGSGQDNQTTITEVLSQFTDTDTITGPYGVRGRTARAVADDDTESGTRRIQEVFTATDQDIDVAIWNMEWLNAERRDQAILRRVTTVFADLTQDIWVLDGVSTETSDALIATLQEQFGQDFGCVTAEDEIHPSQPSTVVIYNCRTVEVVRKPWPAEVERLLRAKAQEDVRLELLKGPVFPSFPARFLVTAKPGEAATGSGVSQFNLFPLFIGERANATLRRRVAAELLEALVEQMVQRIEAEEDAKLDWLILGDTNTPLREARLDHFRDLKFKPILTFDRTRGGITYLSGVKSVLSHLYVPKGMDPIGEDGGYVTSVERAFEGRFIESLTGSPPFGLRVALLDHRMKRDIERAHHYGKGSSSTEGAFESGTSWIWQGLGKRAFIQQNATLLDAAIRDANAHVSSGAPVPLTATDLATLIYCEAGLKGGHIDPEARHSNGERGLLPLPSNLGFWLGGSAPAHDTQLPLGENIGLYAEYLAQVKNRAVRDTPHGTLYRDLFRAEGIAGHPARQAALLAGVIHGYFLAMNYRGAGTGLDIGRLIEGYRAGTTVPQMLAGTGFVHEGTGILVNRQANIDAALAIFEPA